jgi:integrase
MGLETVTVPDAMHIGKKVPYAVPVFRAMFNQARREGYVEDNPFARLGIKGSQGRKNIVPLKMQELALLVGDAGSTLERRRNKLDNMVLVAARMGLRPGELWALQYDDYLPDKGVVVIRRRVYKGKVGLPKSGRVREVVVPNAMKEWFIGPSGYLIFPAPSGGYWRPSTFHDHWHPIRMDWHDRMDPARRELMAMFRGKKYLDFYELRHYCASFLLDQGIKPEDVAIHLGHTDGGKLVRELYGHPDEDRARERLREKLDEPDSD